MWHAWETRENYTGYWRGSPKERDHLENRGVDGWDQNRFRGDWLGGGVDSLVWLGTGRPGDPGSIPDRGKGFFL
jgi:hypothetical protein